ncbi:MAG: hypothetical protein CME70_12390 [Halobacteriovorax sp.]|nr:hypothetical protein [Halobacteriovorax sp.]|tara:strand:- start:253306 stop:253848 length:543 start_codon:yes stop_codon:yes gene_type:complete
MDQKVEVKEYNPQWKNWYKRLEGNIWPSLSGLAKTICHVGSTSIEGMAAKPVIDIDIVVENFDDFEKIKVILEDLGYEHRGNLGITDRENFKFKNELEIKHNLYVILEDSIAFKNHILLKKHLEEHPRDHKRYRELKQKLAKKSKSSDEYCKKKTELILEFLQTQGLSENEMELIKSENL